MSVWDRRWLVGVLAVAMLLRVGWALTAPRTAAAVDRLPDQREYLSLAQGVLRGRGLRLFDRRFGQEVLAYRLPGYPLLVAACDGSVLGVRLVQVVMDVGTVAAVFLLGRWLAGSCVGRVAAGWVAVNPLYVYFSGLLLTETAFAACVTWGLYALVRRAGTESPRRHRDTAKHDRKKSGKAGQAARLKPVVDIGAGAGLPGDAPGTRGHPVQLAADPVASAACGFADQRTPSREAASGGPVPVAPPSTGTHTRPGFGGRTAADRNPWIALAVVCFAMAVYLRPTALVLGPALAIVAAIGANPKPGRAYRWRPAWVVPVAMGFALLPWAWRNQQRLGTAVWTTTNDGITLYDGFHDGATGASDQRFVEQLPALRTMNEVDRSRDLARRARAWVQRHPWQLPALSLRKAARGWSPVPLSAEFGRPNYRWAGGSYAIVFDACCVAGLLGRRLDRWSKALLLTPALVLTAVQVMTVGSIRYRMPAEASLAVLAGAGGVELVARAGHWVTGRLSATDATAG